jgi:hypothetical protein
MQRFIDPRLAHHLLVIMLLKLAVLGVLWMLFFRQPGAPGGSAVHDGMLHTPAAVAQAR